MDNVPLALVVRHAVAYCGENYTT